MRKTHIFLIITFVILYSLLVFLLNIEIDRIEEIILASVFFFALFSGFFITRQNERYTRVINLLADRDGSFSYLYRMSGLVPRIQKEVKEIIRDHYEKILSSNNWAYHELNPSTTLTDLTNSFGSLTNEEIGGEAKVSTSYEMIWDTIFELQKMRKRIIAAYNERLLLFQWIIIYVLALILVVSFGLIPTDMLIVDIMKIVFGTSVFLVIILIKQLNDLSIFGKNFSRKIAQDVLRILDETDAKELK